MDSDGSLTRLASHILAKSTRGWSPDGQRIAFAARADNSADIYVVDVPSGHVKRLTSSQGENRDPSWSPDGTQLAFSSTRDGALQIYVMSADDGDARRLTNTAGGRRCAVVEAWPGHSSWWWHVHCRSRRLARALIGRLLYSVPPCPIPFRSVWSRRSRIGTG